MKTKKVVALGLFDGMHIGHQTLLKKAAEIGAVSGLPVYAVTFYGLENFKNVRLINTYDDRKRLLSEQDGISDVIPILFDSDFRNMCGRDFIELLVGKYQAVHIVVGENFTFGRDRATTEDLIALAKDNDVKVTVVPLSEVDGQIVSSSKIREALMNGAIEQANRLLGHPHILSGKVIHGRHVGHTIGFPTINILYPEELVPIPRGVYITRTVLSDGSKMQSITNFGVHPTFETAEVPLTETYLFHYKSDLYGQDVRIEFLSFLREEQKFGSIDALYAQLEKDKTAGISYFL